MAQWMNKIMEHIIEKTKLKPYYKNNKVIDFKEEDIVKCSYMSGLFIVDYIHSNKNLIRIHPITYEGSEVCVSPQFLKKININKDSIKVLFDGNT